MQCCCFCLPRLFFIIFIFVKLVSSCRRFNSLIPLMLSSLLSNTLSLNTTSEYRLEDISFSSIFSLTPSANSRSLTCACGVIFSVLNWAWVQASWRLLSSIVLLWEMACNPAASPKELFLIKLTLCGTQFPVLTWVASGLFTGFCGLLRKDVRCRVGRMQNLHFRMFTWVMARAWSPFFFGF